MNIKLKKIGVSCKLQPSLLKQELEHDEINGDPWEARKNECLSFVKNDALSTAFCYASNKMDIEKLTNFGIKNSPTLLSLGKKIFW